MTENFANVSIENEWIRFSLMAYNNVTKKEYESLRQSFFSGFTICQTIIKDAASSLPANHVEYMLQKLEVEANAFWENLVYNGIERNGIH